MIPGFSINPLPVSLWQIPSYNKHTKHKPSWPSTGYYPWKSHNNVFCLLGSSVNDLFNLIDTLIKTYGIQNIFFFEKDNFEKKKSAGNETHAKLPSILIDTFSNRMANSKLNYICGRFNTSHCVCRTMLNYLDFSFLGVTRSVIRLSKKLKDNITCYSRFLSILVYLRDSQMIQAEIPLASYVTQGVRLYNTHKYTIYCISITTQRPILIIFCIF